MESAVIAGVFSVQVILGIVGTLVVYKALEYSWLAGWGVSIVLVVGVTLTEWLLGEALLTVTVDQMQLLIVTAVIGSLVGVLSTVVLTAPDINTDHGQQSDRKAAEFANKQIED